MRPSPVSFGLVTEPTRTAPPGPHRPSGAVNPPQVQYKGEPLDAERGPGLGCFRFQIVLLVILIVLTPLSVGRVPDWVSAALLLITIGLLLVSGQTIIFLLRLVAADRRTRRRPLASSTPTVGQLEEAGPEADRDAPTAGPPPADASPSQLRFSIPFYFR